MLMTPEGPLTRNEPTDEEWDDIIYGFRMAKEICRLEIGQTIVVKQQAVMAVEAIEGTDEAILRGGKLASGGATVVKVSRPEQDMRFDVPVVGSRTLECMKEVGIRVLALEAGSSIFLNKDEFLGEAERAERLEALEARLPERVREARLQATGPLRVRQEVEALRDAGASEREIFAARERAFGTEAAERLAEMDRERAEDAEGSGD